MGNIISLHHCPLKTLNESQNSPDSLVLPLVGSLHTSVQAHGMKERPCVYDYMANLWLRAIAPVARYTYRTGRKTFVYLTSL